MEGNIRGCRKHVRAIDLSVWPTLLASLTPTPAPSVRGAGCIRGLQTSTSPGERGTTCLWKRIRGVEMERERPVTTPDKGEKKEGREEGGKEAGEGGGEEVEKWEARGKGRKGGR